MKRCFACIILLSIWLGSAGFAPSAVQLYSKAVEFAKAGQEYFAFMHYNKLLRSYPTSKYRQEALFATGEYYYRIYDYREASEVFRTFLAEFPESEGKLYVLAYLLSIAQRDQNADSAEAFKRQIIDLQRVSFVFREKKEIAYRSPLYQRHKAVIHIDKIEFYVEGKLFAKVVY